MAATAINLDSGHSPPFSSPASHLSLPHCPRWFLSTSLPQKVGIASLHPLLRLSRRHLFLGSTVERSCSLQPSSSIGIPRSEGGAKTDEGGQE